MRILKTLLLFLFFTITTNAQKYKLSKLGNVSIEDVSMQFYDKDSTANAVILDEFSQVYVNSKRLSRYTLDYYVKIKFFNRKEIDKSIIELPNFKKNYLENIEGITYNLNENGEIERSKLSKDQIISEENENKVIKFVLPNVKPGSVVEYKFSITTSNYKIYQKYFQKSIPVKNLFYKFSISGYPQYFISLLGTIKPTLKKKYLEKRCKGGLYKCYSFEYEFKNIPAFKEEPLTSNPENLISKLEVEREYTKQTETGVLEGWRAIDYHISKRYSKAFNDASNFTNLLSSKVRGLNNSLSKAEIIFSFIQDYFIFNKQYGVLNYIDIDEAFKKKTGNIEEINFSLYAFLQKFGIQSHLVLLSDKNSGNLTKIYPSINKINYMLVKATIDNKTYYLDASNKFHFFGQIPFACLIENDIRVFDRNEVNDFYVSRWEAFNYNKISTINNKTILSLTEGKNLRGEILIKKEGYFALADRKIIADIGLDNYKKEIDLNSFDEINTEIIDSKDLNKPLIVKVNVSQTLEEDASKKIRINPFKIKSIAKNPFLSNKRIYPVELNYPFAINNNVSLEFPENYKLVQHPKNIAISLPNNGGRCIIRSTISGNKISIYVRLQINKKLFSPEEYHFLKEFYNKIVIAENSYLILEKK